MTSCAGGSGLGVPGLLCIHCLPSPRPGTASLGACRGDEWCWHCRSAILGLSVIAGWTDRTGFGVFGEQTALKTVEKLATTDPLQMWKWVFHMRCVCIS